MSLILNHKHILITASGLAAPPHDGATIDAWLRRLVELVDMQVLIGPYSLRCDTLGNEGATGIVCIETSHASMHCWDTGIVPFLTMDLYSCRDFDAATVIEHMQAFQPESVEYMVVDRNSGMKVIDQGIWHAPVG